MADRASPSLAVAMARLQSHRDLKALWRVAGGAEKSRRAHEPRLIMAIATARSAAATYP